MDMQATFRPNLLLVSSLHGSLQALTFFFLFSELYTIDFLCEERVMSSVAFFGHDDQQCMT
jgi:hypothetical protein